MWWYDGDASMVAVTMKFLCSCLSIVSLFISEMGKWALHIMKPIFPDTISQTFSGSLFEWFFQFQSGT